MSDVYIAVVCRINKICAGKYTSRGTSEELRESQDECNSQFSIVFFYYCYYFSSFVSIYIYIYTCSFNYLGCVPFTTAKLGNCGCLIALVPYHLKALNALESIKLMQCLALVKLAGGIYSLFANICLQILSIFYILGSFYQEDEKEL